MSRPIRKAVFPVAGLGTRFLPATKANPKEMLPIVDKPLIQYAAEEAVAAGITELIFVTGRNKRSIPDHFDKAYELEAELEQKHKQKMLDMVRNILPEGISCIYIRQAEALGLGHAVLCAKPVVNDEPFAVILADDLIDSPDRPCLKQMIEVYDRYSNSVIAVESVSREATRSYGIVEASPVSDQLSRIQSIVEKPAPEDAPSNLGVVGRYIFTPEIIGLLEQTGQGAGGEIQLTDAIAKLLDHKEVYALEFTGKRHDCGSKLGYLQATVELGLKHPELSEEFRDFIVGLAATLSD